MLPESGSLPKGSVFGCMYKIQHALKNHDLYHMNYLHMMNSPMVLKLKQQILKLKTQNNEYKTIINELTSKLDDTKKKKMQSQMTPGIKIKKEPGIREDVIVIDLVEEDDDEVVAPLLRVPKNENIGAKTPLATTWKWKKKCGPRCRYLPVIYWVFSVSLWPLSTS